MKNLRIVLLLASTSLIIQSCGVFCKLNTNVTLKTAYVESGHIKNDTSFVEGRAFKAFDTAIGMVDSSNCTSHNSYLDETGWVYVFEGGKIPQNVAKDSKYRRSITLKTANWQNDSVYTLPNDAEICVIPADFKIYLREKGDYQRQKAFVYGTTVYRFKNRYVIEDYGNLLTYHEHLRPNVSPPNFFTAVNLSSTEYQATFNGTAFKGIIDYSSIPFTPLGQTDKIRFDKPFDSNGVSYRLRHVYIKHDSTTIKNFFDRGDTVKVEFRRDMQILEKTGLTFNQDNLWFKYLNGLYPKYVEPVIRGYKCPKCYKNTSSQMFIRKNIFDSINGLDSPPMPVSGNGTGNLK